MLIRIGSASPGRVWGGVGPLQIPADYIEDEDGAEYSGAGELLSVPDQQLLINSDAGDTMTIAVSGVSASMIALAIDEAEAVKGAPFDVGRVEFDEAWQLIGVVWLRRYTVAKITPSRQADDKGVTRTISFTLDTYNTNRSYAPAAFWTPADQAKKSPTDRFCDGVSSMTLLTARRFTLKDGS